jgi:hypothetical protein
MGNSTDPLQRFAGLEVHPIEVHSWYTLGGYTGNSCHHPLVTRLTALYGPRTGAGGRRFGLAM